MTKSIKLYIVTYKKNDVLNRNLETLWASARHPERLNVTILSNHPDVAIAPENARPNLRVLINATRARNSWGFLSRDWNFGIQDAFVNWRNPNNVDWCVLAQNDVEWVDGWDEFLDTCDRFDFITQPAGDQSMAINANAVRRLGFFDERFCTLHFHEFDYFLRAMLALGERASVNDTQGKVAGASWNAVGCVLTKAASSGFDEGNGDTLHTFRSWPEMRNLLFHKWNAPDLETVENKADFVRARQAARLPEPEEINTYPFFWDGATPAEAPAITHFLPDYNEVDAANPAQRSSLRLKRSWRSLLGGAIQSASKEAGRIGIIIQGPLIASTKQGPLIASTKGERQTLDVLKQLAQSPLRSRFHVCLSVWHDDPAPLSTLLPLIDQAVLCEKPARRGSCNRLYQAHAVSCALDAMDALFAPPAHVLKTRPDIVLSDRFLQKIVGLADNGGASEKVLVTNLFTRREPFHVSDMVVFSSRANLRMWFEADAHVYYEDLYSPEVQFARVFVRNRKLPYTCRLEDYLRFLRDWILLVDFADEGLVWFKNPGITTRAHNHVLGLLHDRDVGPVLTRLVSLRFYRVVQRLPIGMRSFAALLLAADAIGSVLVNLPFIRRRVHTYTADRAGAEYNKAVFSRWDATPVLTEQTPAVPAATVPSAPIYRNGNGDGSTSSTTAAGTGGRL